MRTAWANFAATGNPSTQRRAVADVRTPRARPVARDATTGRSRTTSRRVTTAPSGPAGRLHRISTRHQGESCPRSRCTQRRSATPEQYIAALTDFGPGRSKIFGNSADDYLKVHDQKPGHADVTEGSGGVWERLSYDWTDPNRLVAETTDSNIWGGHSGHTYRFTRNAAGTTEIDYVVVREERTRRDGSSASCSAASARAGW